MCALTPSKLHDFLAESNRIEGEGPPSREQVDEASAFLACLQPEVRNVVWLVESLAPRARLRDRRGLNVVVGAHHPPPGGPIIAEKLSEMLLSLEHANPYDWHAGYETLHPFTDGNGCSGRLLWLWQMERQTPGGLQRLGFLHAFYYQALDAQRRRP